MILEFFYRKKNADRLTRHEHSHMNQIEIIHIVNGSGNIILGKKKYEFQSGSLFLFDGSMPHYLLPAKNEDYIRNKLAISKSVLTAVSGIREFDVLHFNADSQLNSQLNELFRKINECDFEKDIFKIRSVIFSIFDKCYSYNANTIHSAKDLTYAIMRYVSNNLRSNLTTEEISAHCHISKYHMCRRFKEQTGVTIHSYILSQKIFLAKKLLDETAKSLSDIAFESGFSDPSHFTRAFKEETGITPGKYRKIMTGN